jgi:VP9 protein
MSDLLEHRANKRFSRTIDRASSVGLNANDKEVINKGEIKELCLTNEGIAGSFKLGALSPLVPYGTSNYFNNSRYNEWMIRSTLRNDVLCFAYAAGNNQNSTAIDVAGNSQICTQVANGVNYSWIPLGALSTSIPIRAATLMILSQQTIIGPTTQQENGKVSISYIITTSNIGESLIKKRFDCLIDMHTFNHLSITVSGSSIDASPGDDQLVFNETQLASGDVASVPSDARVIFFCSVRDREHFPIINALLALSNK